MKKIIFILFLLSSTCLYSQSDRLKISEPLYRILNNLSDNEKIRVFVILKDKIDIEKLSYQFDAENVAPELRSEILINSLKNKAYNSQKSLLGYFSYLKSFGKIDDFHSLWIVNCIWIKATPDVITLLALRNDVDFIELDNPLKSDEPVNANSKILNKSPGIETGLKVIGADKMWRLGFKGGGRIVMSIDNGVDGNHPALNYKWRGLSVPWYHAWLDGDGSSFPTYCSNHGTHTMGIMCGLGKATGDTIGVAQDAYWISAKRSCSGDYSHFAITAFQWAMDPDSNSATHDFPDVISCSWNSDDSTGSECNGVFKSTLITLETAGIAVVFSAGNSGPTALTITSPKNINTNVVNSFCVGSVNGNNIAYPISGFSSRGPSICGGTGSLLIKPEVVAPGENVRSSVLNGQYDVLSGTSMAAPHVAGSVALLKSFAPNLTGKQILLGLYYSAADLGTPGEDNIYGMGLINVYNAMIALGPQIIHTSLSDTIDVNGPYKVSASITSSLITNINPDTSRVILYYSRNSATVTDSVKMFRSAGNIFYAYIPGNGLPALYRYFIRVYDSLSVRGQSPADAPFTVYSFNSGVVNVGNIEPDIPSKFELNQNYPNPFNPASIISFELPVATFVKLEIFDLTGKQIVTLFEGDKNAGYYSVIFNSINFASGIYFYRLSTSAGFSCIKKLAIVK
jgi:subtilisin family serine protease